MFQNFWTRIQVPVRKFYKFENPTPVQTRAPTDAIEIFPYFYLSKKWPRKLQLLPEMIG